MTADVTETMDQDVLLGQFRERYQALINPVSYTHLTLPTNREV